MADTKPQASKRAAPAATAPAVARPSAVIEIDVTKALPEDRFSAPDVRRTAWDAKLDEVYALTEAGSIPTNEDGSLKFVQIGRYKDSQGSKAQIKAFAKRDLDKTYEFRSNGGDLYVRVRAAAE